MRFPALHCAYMQPQPCPKDPARVAENGRAFAGSQRWIQHYVNYEQSDLNDAILQSQDSLRGSRGFQWVSPLESDGFTEYRDEAFLACLGLPHLGGQYSVCWPRNGPCWDALAIVRRNGEDGVLLVEAKSYPGEFFGNGCGAGARSRSRIEHALAATKASLGADAQADWLGRLYQFANRPGARVFVTRKARSAGVVGQHLLHWRFSLSHYFGAMAGSAAACLRRTRPRRESALRLYRVPPDGGRLKMKSKFWGHRLKEREGTPQFVMLANANDSSSCRLFDGRSGALITYTTSRGGTYGAAYGSIFRDCKGLLPPPDVKTSELVAGLPRHHLAGERRRDFVAQLSDSPGGAKHDYLGHRQRVCRAGLDAGGHSG